MQIDPDFLKAHTDKIIAAITSPAYVEAMKKLRGTPSEMRRALAEKILTPDALRAAGVPLPAGMRISSRYFQSDFPESIELGDMNIRPNMETPDGAQPAWFCGCGGAVGVCGGAGGGPD